MPRISIITPTYNSENTLHGTVEGYDIDGNPILGEHECINDFSSAQLIRDLHYLNTAGNNAILDGANPRVTYHGTNYGNFSVFDSSQSNATIGGSSATGEKGNFTTDDLKAALNYGEVNPEYLYYGDKNPITNSPFDKYIDVRNLSDWRNTDFLRFRLA